MTEKNASRCLTSLLLVEERLVEADFFVRKMMRAGPDTVGYFLNAFLSTARSVTFLLQKELAHVTGFRQWWEAQRLVLGADATARFFLELRNFSQKEGRTRVACRRQDESRPFVEMDVPIRRRTNFVAERLAGSRRSRCLRGAHRQAGARCARVHGGLPVSNLSQFCPERCWRGSIRAGCGGDVQSARPAVC